MTLIEKGIIRSHGPHVDVLPVLRLGREDGGRDGERVAPAAVDGRGHLQAGIEGGGLEDVVVEDAVFFVFEVVLRVRVDGESRRAVVVGHLEASHGEKMIRAPKMVGWCERDVRRCVLLGKVGEP